MIIEPENKMMVLTITLGRNGEMDVETEVSPEIIPNLCTTIARGILLRCLETVPKDKRSE